MNKLYVLTSNEIKQYKGRRFNKFDIVKPRPRAPPPSPRLLEHEILSEQPVQSAEPELIMPAPSFEPEVISPNSSIDPELELSDHSLRPEIVDWSTQNAPLQPLELLRQQGRHKYLADTLGLPHADYHVVGPIKEEDPLYEHADNLSDIYGVPLIEDPATLITDKTHPTPWDFPRIEGQAYSITTEESSDYDQEDNNFFPPKIQVPSQAMILYLRGKGKSFRAIRELMRDVDPKFLYESESRWWNRERIADLPDFNDGMVEKVLSIAKAPKEEWESHFDANGKEFPEDFRAIKRRQRETALHRLCKQSLENYFYWRMKGIVPHQDILR